MNPLPEFYQLLSQAYQASTATDNFDLDTESPESAQKYGQLVREEVYNCIRLVRYIQDHGDEIVRAGDKILGLVLKERI